MDWSTYCIDIYRNGKMKEGVECRGTTAMMKLENYRKKTEPVNGFAQFIFLFARNGMDSF